MLWNTFQVEYPKGGLNFLWSSHLQHYELPLWHRYNKDAKYDA